MSISLTEDVKTLEELGNDPAAVVRQVHQAGRPVIITVNGKPDVVLLDVKMYEKMIRTINMSRLIHKAEASIRREGTIPLERFLKERRREDNTSR